MLLVYFQFPIQSFQTIWETGIIIRFETHVIRYECRSFYLLCELMLWCAETSISLVCDPPLFIRPYTIGFTMLLCFVSTTL